MSIANYFHSIYDTRPRISRLIPDKIELRRYYRSHYGYSPNLKNPKLFGEKIQWYKLNYRKPIMNKMVDKYLVRSFVADMGFEYTLNKLYGVYESVDEIDLESLPEKFVLKGTHGSGMNIICRNKNELDWEESKLKMKKWLKVNYYFMGRQWVYKNLKPRIICEKYLENKNFSELTDYKIYCFNGKPEVVFVYFGRYSDSGPIYDIYDLNWNFLPELTGRPPTISNLKKPDKFNEMLEISKKLSKGFPFMRVDLYFVKGKIIFGELTFYPGSGFAFLKFPYRDVFFGELFELPSL